jgi:hypothetical protein
MIRPNETDFGIGSLGDDEDVARKGAVHVSAPGSRRRVVQHNVLYVTLKAIRAAAAFSRSR